MQIEQLCPMRCDEAAVDIDLVDEAHGTLSQRTVDEPGDRALSLAR
jgi:hypothetical protein